MTPEKSVSTTSAKRRVAANLLDAVFLLSVLFVPFMWLASSISFGDDFTISWKKIFVLTPFLVFGMRTWLRSFLKKDDTELRSLWDLDLIRKLVLAISVVFFSLVICEQMLRAVDFEAKTPPIIIKGKDNQTIGKYGILRDPVLAWKFSPNGEFKGWKINRFGFKDREITKDNPVDRIRVICFGDSCTADGGPPYAGCLHQLLREKSPNGQSWEAFNMGVYGYSAVQGLKYYNMVGRDFDPDIVTLYFGWNDHWISGYRPDSHNLAFKMNRFSALILQRLFQKRIGQLAFRFISPKQSSMSIKMKDGSYPDDIEEYLRVPPNEFRYTLEVFVDEIREDGALPLLITPPNGPSFTTALLHNGQAKSLEQLAKTHEKYTNIIREVAKEKNCPILDLAATMEGEADYDLFNKDGIHLTQEGLWRIADELYAKICSLMNDQEWKKISQK